MKEKNEKLTNLKGHSKRKMDKHNEKEWIYNLKFTHAKGEVKTKTDPKPRELGGGFWVIARKK